MPSSTPSAKRKSTSKADPEAASTSKKLKSAKKEKKSDKSDKVALSTPSKTKTPQKPTTKPTSISSSSPDDGFFSSATVKLHIHLPPALIGREYDGIREHLSQYIMRYVPEVDGVVLAYDNVQVLDETAQIFYDSPFTHFWIRVTLLIFTPRTKREIIGVVNKVSSDHIGLLVHGIFNASIAADHIRRSELRWDPDVAGWRRDRSEDAEELVVGVGSVIRFTIIDLIKSSDMLIMAGSLTRHPQRTGIITNLPPAPVAEGGDEDGKSAMESVKSGAE
ncbi:hypothetical protein DFS34DRAFT_583418 [Phlyctochytrium arcticum]|nr:hypothetical protein DFS34DRAFT_583418 [Phlyctochytrium arcticum]